MTESISTLSSPGKTSSLQYSSLRKGTTPPWCGMWPSPCHLWLVSLVLEVLKSINQANMHQLFSKHGRTLRTVHGLQSDICLWDPLLHLPKDPQSLQCKSKQDTGESSFPHLCAFYTYQTGRGTMSIILLPLFSVWDQSTVLSNNIPHWNKAKTGDSRYSDTQ